MSEHNNKFVWKHYVEVCIKSIFLVIPKFWGFKKSTASFAVFRISFYFQSGALEIVKNCLSQKRK